MPYPPICNLFFIRNTNLQQDILLFLHRCRLNASLILSQCGHGRAAARQKWKLRASVSMGENEPIHGINTNAMAKTSAIQPQSKFDIRID